MSGLTSLAGFMGIVIVGTGLVMHDRISDPQWLATLAVAWLFLLAGSRIRLPDRLPPFNRSLIRTALTLFTVFVIISAQLVRIQVVERDDTATRTAIAADGETIGNPRLANAQLAVQRGEIYDRDGNLVAGTERDGDIYLRYYPDATTAYVAGYYSPLLYGTAGLEDTYDNVLSGRAGNDPIDRVINDLLNRPQQGSNLILSLDSGLQQQAMDLLAGRAGSVVVMDVETGAVIVFASGPVFDPNQLFTSSLAENDAASAYWSSLIESGNDPLVLRANLGLYTPGSTFKTVTAATAIELGLISPDDEFEDDGSIDIDGRILMENNRPDNSRTMWTVVEALAWSLNVVFAQIGLLIGASGLWDMVESFGISERIPFDLPVAIGQLANSEDALGDDNLLADTAFGQGEIQVTPLYMCMIAAMFANDGDMMVPSLVASIESPGGAVLEETSPRVWRSPISPGTAGALQTMMINAVENGAVSGAALGGYLVGGKTGTAETGNGGTHQWFIGFIGDEEPRYAVSVVLEDAPSGLGSAVNIGREILLATIESASSGD